jgi:hypothetical protein
VPQEKEARRREAEDDKISRRRERTAPADDYDTLFASDAAVNGEKARGGLGEGLGAGVGGAGVGGGLGAGGGEYVTTTEKVTASDVVRAGREGEVVLGGSGSVMGTRGTGQKRRAVTDARMEGGAVQRIGREGERGFEETEGGSERVPANTGLLKSR